MSCSKSACIAGGVIQVWIPVGTRCEGAWSCPVQKFSVVSRCWRCLKDVVLVSLETEVHTQVAQQVFRVLLLTVTHLHFATFTFWTKGLCSRCVASFLDTVFWRVAQWFKAALVSAVCWHCYRTEAFSPKSSDKTRLSSFECIKLVAPGNLPGVGLCAVLLVYCRVAVFVFFVCVG